MQPTTHDAWHVTRGGQTYGPYTWAQIAEHARGGRIGRGDKIYDPRNTAWIKPSKVPGLFGPGGVAAAPVGLSAAIKLAVGIVVALAVVLGMVTSLYLWNDGMDSQHITDALDGIVADVAQDTSSVTAATAVVPPEGLAFKGTFSWQSENGDKYNDPCYLWIYAYDGSTCADFDFGTVDGWPLYLKSQSGSQYVFEMSDRSTVGRVKMTVGITDTSASGKITNIDWHADSFSLGTFTGTAIPYEQYKAETQ